MKSIIGPALMAVLLAAVGAVFWTTGQSERRLAEVHQQIATLQYGGAMNEGDEVDATLGLARRLPGVGDAMETDMRDERAVAQYWRSEYTAVEPKRDASGALTDTDPQLLLLAANAEFRASQHATDRAELVRRLDRVVKTYGEVLKHAACSGDNALSAAPASACEMLRADASYNYEYVVRLRDTLARSRPPARPESGRNAQRLAADRTRDLPSGQTLHGTPGAPPKGTDMSQFKIVIPKRGDERKDNPEAGKGGAKVRKG